MKLTLTNLAQDLREMNRNYDGPGEVTLCVIDDGDFRWSAVQVDTLGTHINCYGCEEIPGDGAPFDAIATARRLLSDWRSKRPRA